MPDESSSESEEIGPIRRAIRAKLKQLQQVKEWLEEAQHQKAAGRIEELRAERDRRIREMKELLE